MNHIKKLLEVMATLRDPEQGCPWDIEQDFRSIAPYTIEEAYEVADAIARDDLPGLKDELGDLLLQVVYHARMAEEAAEFDFDDVAACIVAKMIRRHPHVFGDEDQRAAGMIAKNWERIKSEERADDGDSGNRVRPRSRLQSWKDLPDDPLLRRGEPQGARLRPRPVRMSTA